METLYPSIKRMQTTTPKNLQIATMDSELCQTMQENDDSITTFDTINTSLEDAIEMIFVLAELLQAKDPNWRKGWEMEITRQLVKTMDLTSRLLQIKKEKEKQIKELESCLKI